MDYDWDGWRETAECIGRIAMQAARLEFSLATLEVNLIGSDLAFDVLVGQGWSTMKQGCVALLQERIGRGPYAHHSPAVMTDFRAILEHIKHADALMNDRNRVVHSVWADPDHAGQHEAILMRRWGKLHSSNWTAELLRQLHLDLIQAARDLDASAVYIREQNEERF